MQALYALDATRDAKSKTKSPTSVLNIERHSSTLCKNNQHSHDVVPIAPPSAQFAIWYTQAYLAEKLFRPPLQPP